MRKIYFIIIMIGVFAGAKIAIADDVAVFTADENDVAAFDHMLEHKAKESPMQRASERNKSDFGQSVREEVRKLKQEGRMGDLGKWVREQRRRDNDSNRGSSNSDSGGGAGADSSQSKEAREFVNERHGDKQKKPKDK